MRPKLLLGCSLRHGPWFQTLSANMFGNSNSIQQRLAARGCSDRDRSSMSLPDIHTLLREYRPHLAHCRWDNTAVSIESEA